MSQILVVFPSKASLNAFREYYLDNDGNYIK